ncbi:GNAT family N-acetyltransferase [Inediibacterium massiliense]|uniref:GNAT family N-acetyltransferase n=1 Tax=Inediibacterium massiliense TaxID=1658111 RepID=UPI0006B3FCD6|nr:GNAT family protein [Inediibacterium massiliense]
METKDLIIRNSIWDDLDIFYKWELTPEVNEFFSISENQSYEMVVRTYIHDDDNPSQRQYTIVLKETGMPIGRIVLGDLIEGWKVEVFRIYIGDLALRNKGYGRQAMEAIMKLCFEEWNLERIYLDHYTGNPASFLYQSLGFKYEGVLRNNCRKNGKLYDVHLMSMLKDEYVQKYQHHNAKCK